MERISTVNRGDHLSGRLAGWGLGQSRGAPMRSGEPRTSQVNRGANFTARPAAWALGLCPGAPMRSGEPRTSQVNRGTNFTARPAAWGLGLCPGGDTGTRTPNLGIANAALSQLSYIPTCGASTDYSNATLLLQRAYLRWSGPQNTPRITYNYTFVRRCNTIAHAWSAML